MTGGIRLIRTTGTGAVATLVALGALLLTSSYAGAVVTDDVNGTVVTVSSDGAGDLLSVSCVNGQTRRAGSAVNLLPCASVTQLVVSAGPGTDTVNLALVTVADFPALLRASTTSQDGEADVVVGSQAGDSIVADGLDTVNAGAGNDRVDGGSVIQGGPGNDHLLHVNGSVDAGEGDDRIVDPASGSWNGGPGQDSLEVDFGPFAAFDQTIVVTDSQLALTTPVATATAPISGIETLDFRLMDGAEQTLDSSAFGGVSLVQGLDGPDVIRTGPAEDRVDGGAGNDDLATGTGSDVLLAGSGDDTVRAQDGAADRVDCGPGTDSVQADRVDVLTSCEQVAFPAPDTGKVKGPRTVVKGTTARFRFTSPVAGARFECAVDKGKFRRCASPFRLRTDRLSLGRHKLAVRAVQPAGTPDPSPSKLRFRVVADR